MELNTKTHDITQRIDRSLKNKTGIPEEDYNRLIYLISRYRKHSDMLSREIQDYKEMLDFAINKTKKKEIRDIDNIIKALLGKSEKIREVADRLLK